MSGDAPFDLSPRRMALICAAPGFLWATTSNSLVVGLPNHDLIQMVRGWLLVVLPALLVYVLVDRNRPEPDRASE